VGVPISLAYSVDADDAFMFHALVAGAVDTRGLAFTHARGDTAWLNALAEAAGADVVAVSVGAYPALARQYLLLPHGASVGRGFGPVVVSRRPMTLEELAGRRVAIPGPSTTAFLVLRLMQPGIVPKVVPIAPFAAVFEALERGEVDAALLIHEGRLLFERHGCVAIAELGQWWLRETGLPLPLGLDVVRKDLGPDLAAAVSLALRRSIEYAEAHKAEAMRYAMQYGRDLDEELNARFVGMYVNDWTLDFGPRGRQAVAELLARGHAAGVIPTLVTPEFIG